MIEVQHLTKRYGRVTAVRRRQLPGRTRRDPRVPRTQRRRQDDDDAHPDRLHAGHRRQGHCRRIRRLRPAARGQAPHRLPARDAAALPGHERLRVSRLRRQDQRRPVGRPSRARQVRDGAHAHRRHGEPPLRQAVEGLQAARRPRPGAHPQPRRAHPRRADRRPRPEADHRDARADQGARRRSHDHPEHAHPARGRADVPARGHHQQGPASSPSTRRTT